MTPIPGPRPAFRKNPNPTQGKHAVLQTGAGNEVASLRTATGHQARNNEFRCCLQWEGEPGPYRATINLVLDKETQRVYQLR